MLPAPPGDSGEPPRGPVNPVARRWAARQAEIAAARAADAAAMAQRQDEAQRRLEAGYGNRLATWAGLGIAALLALGGLFLIERLIQGNRLDDCLLAHRQTCGALPAAR
jgi:uncharacterized membrane protein